MRVFHSVGDRFLNNAVESRFLGAPETAVDCCSNADGDSGALGDAVGEKPQRSKPSEVIENRGSKLVGKAAQLSLHLTQQLIHPSDLRMVKLGQGAGKFGEGDMDRDKKLARFVVHGVRDSFDFFLKSLIQAAQSFDRVLKPPMRHLVRGLCLGEEIGPGNQEFLLEPGIFRIGDNVPESLMMDRAYLHQTFSLRDGVAPEPGFTRIPVVIEQRCPVLPLEGCRFLFRHPLGSSLHGRTPVNRATRTSASSVPLPYRSRILSAARCGASVQLCVWKAEWRSASPRKYRCAWRPAKSRLLPNRPLP